MNDGDNQGDDTLQRIELYQRSFENKQEKVEEFSSSPKQQQEKSDNKGRQEDEEESRCRLSCRWLSFLSPLIPSVLGPL